TWTWCSASPSASPCSSRERCWSRARRPRLVPMRGCARSTWASASMPDALSFTHVIAGYGETVVLDDVSLSLPSGGTLALLRRNGVGKSTVLATAMGHPTMHGGSVRLAGQDVTRAPAYVRARAGLGYVPQEREIFPSLTVDENLTVAARAGRWT